MPIFEIMFALTNTLARNIQVNLKVSENSGEWIKDEEPIKDDLRETTKAIKQREHTDKIFHVKDEL